MNTTLLILGVIAVLLQITLLMASLLLIAAASKYQTDLIALRERIEQDYYEDDDPMDDDEGPDPFPLDDGPPRWTAHNWPPFGKGQG